MGRSDEVMRRVRPTLDTFSNCNIMAENQIEIFIYAGLMLILTLFLIAYLNISKLEIERQTEMDLSLRVLGIITELSDLIHTNKRKDNSKQRCNRKS